MIVVALDTTTRAGSLALARDGLLVEVFVGDASRTHATRLPGDLVQCLQRHGLEFGDVDLFAVAAGPGSFTGLRIGIATIQGLAFANERKVVAVSALEALAWAAVTSPDAPRTPYLVGPWMDAQRHEVYSELYRVVPDEGASPLLQVLEPASVGDPAALVERWGALVSGEAGLVLAGDGALVYREIAAAAFPDIRLVEPVPPLAPTIAAIARDRASQGLAVPPHAVRPIYVRRPDAELARDRRLRDVPPGAEAEPIPHE